MLVKSFFRNKQLNKIICNQKYFYRVETNDENINKEHFNTGFVPPEFYHKTEEKIKEIDLNTNKTLDNINNLNNKIENINSKFEHINSKIDFIIGCTFVNYCILFKLFF